jgi:type I restriction enzyme, S subunit
MIADLKPHAKYRLAEGEWLGEIPSHWTVRRMKYVAQEVDSRSISGKEQLLRVSQFTGVTERLRVDGQDEQDTRAASLVGYKRVEPDDLVINIMLAWNGSMGVSHYPGIASPAYCVYRFRPNALPWYFHHLLRSPAYKARIKAMSTGVVESRLRLYSDDLFRIEALLPPPEEQAAIVRFLDWANGRLERTIRAKRRVIALLTEQKQAIIHRAVTRGLDPAVPLKPSGMAWLGDIPAHWELWRISRFARVGNGSTPSRADPRYWNSGTYPWLNSSQVNRGFIDSADQFVTSAALRECHLPRVQAGSLLVAITGQGKTRGMSAVLGVEATINQHIAYISPRVPVTKSEYLHLYFTAAYLQLRAASDDSGSTKGAITCEDLKRFKIAVPPLAEQLAIQTFVDSETLALNTTISRLNREIDLLREYRTRLVADVVTGKLDVREAAARLPDEVEVENVGEAGDMSDLDGLSDESEFMEEESAA